MPPTQTPPPDNKKTAREITISIAIILVLVLAGFMVYKWYRANHNIRADQMTRREREAYLEEAARLNDARPAITSENQDAFTKKVQNSETPTFTDAQIEAYTQAVVQ